MSDLDTNVGPSNYEFAMCETPGCVGEAAYLVLDEKVLNFYCEKCGAARGLKRGIPNA